MIHDSMWKHKTPAYCVDVVVGGRSHDVSFDQLEGTTASALEEHTYAKFFSLFLENWG